MWFDVSVPTSGYTTSEVVVALISETFFMFSAFFSQAEKVKANAATSKDSRRNLFIALGLNLGNSPKIRH
jgi:hypothetical protein